MEGTQAVAQTLSPAKLAVRQDARRHAPHLRVRATLSGANVDFRCGVQPVWHEVVTHVLGTFRYLCVRARHIASVLGFTDRCKSEIRRQWSKYQSTTVCHEHANSDGGVELCER